jgi:GT2 family glycosyltransferase
MISYNKAPYLELSIPAIFSSVADKNVVEFLFLNNGSSDHTREVINSLREDFPISVFNVDKNVGLNGYGILADCAVGDIIVTVDDDVFYVSRGWEAHFERALSVRFGGRMFGYVSSDTINGDSARMPEVMGHAKIGGLEIELGAAGGWFAATSRHAMEEVGGFHQGMPEMHLEDLDFQQRAWRHGYLCGTVLNVKVHHARSPRIYKELGCESTYMEKMRLAQEAGIELEPLA